MKLGGLKPVDDRKVIERVLKGDTEAFNLLVRQWEKPIYNFILRMIGDRDEAMDLCQDVFLKAFRELGTLKDRDRFTAWLYRIARNTVIDHYRTKKEEANFDEAYTKASHANLNEQIDAKNVIEEAGKYLDILRPEQKEIIIMRVWDGLSYKEIAEVLGKTETNCRVMFSRAVGALRKEAIVALLLALSFIN